MPAARMTADLLQETLDLVALHGGVTKAAAATGIRRTTLQARYNQARLGVQTTERPHYGASVGQPPERDHKISAPRAPLPPDSPPRRHFVIPDTQVRPGVPTDHIAWIAQAIVEYRPDVIIHLGDHWDFHSLNAHEKPGSAPLEGARFKDDVDAGNIAFASLRKPMEEEQERDPTWKPRKVFLQGNHEFRADRAAESDPKWLGTIGSNHCQVGDFEWHNFLQPVEIDGILYSHYFKMQNSNNAIGGSTDNRLNKIGKSHVQGHQVGFLYGNRVYPDGRTLHSLTTGSAYLHTEGYRGPQCNKHFRGVTILNEVRDGNFCIMALSLDYLCRKYERMSLYGYMTKRYPDGDWATLA